VPDRRRVEDLIQAVVRGDYLQAIADFYHPDASMQENGQPPRSGRQALLENEEKVLAAMRMRAFPPESFLVDGDRVVIPWTFDMTDRAGVTRRLEELALQHWRGDRIERERFFYDSAALTPK
jgi:ketosteroid isomerase-like protein